MFKVSFHLFKSFQSNNSSTQGWIGNRAYRAFSWSANALKGPTECFFFFLPLHRDSEQPVAHWFVSCIDSVNHTITMHYRGRNSYFATPKERFTPTPSAFPMFSQQLYQEHACSAVNDAGQRAMQEEERRVVESVKCLIGTRNGGWHLNILTYAHATSVKYANTF